MEEVEKKLNNDEAEKINSTPNEKKKVTNLKPAPPENGEFITYNEDGTIKERANYKNGKKDGENCIYEKTMLKQRKMYKEGMLDGFIELYNDKNIMKLHTSYANNYANGISYFFHPTGTINAIAWYKDGLLEGPFLAFNAEGLLLKRSIYQEGQLNGQSIIYHKNGTVYEIGEYKNSKKEGTWLNKTPEGKLMKTTFYNAGVVVYKKIEKAN